jgi:uncharacterized protein (TIGR03083 family)
VNTPSDHDSEHRPVLDRERYLAAIAADTQRFAAAVRTGPLGAEITACPGWDLRRLTAHLGVIHRWAGHCAVHGAPPESTGDFEPDPQLDPEALADWFESGAAELIERLGTIDPDGPTWHPFPVERVGRVWPRRQAHEISIHRWDAERAVGTPAPIDPALASDGIDEYFEVAIPRLVKRESLQLPSGSFHVHCTDTHGEWLAIADHDGYRFTREHAKGTAALRGPAEAILLRLWNRETGGEHELSPVGDEIVLDAWLSLTGL